MYGLRPNGRYYHTFFTNWQKASVVIVCYVHSYLTRILFTTSHAIVKQKWNSWIKISPGDNNNRYNDIHTYAVQNIQFYCLLQLNLFTNLNI